jgi:hypothetical protein
MKSTKRRARKLPNRPRQIRNERQISNQQRPRTTTIELIWLTMRDIDMNSGIVSLTGAKHTIGREGKLEPDTPKLLKRLSTNLQTVTCSM